MNALTIMHPALTMSSREIAELTKKEIFHVHRDIRTMLDELADDPELDHVREDKDGRGYTTCFHLTKSLTMTLVAGYNIKLRKAIIDRWQELEAQADGPDLATDEGKLLLIQDLVSKQLSLMAEKKQVEVERDEAIRTKALIGSKREATAMATASAATREAARLKARMGEAADMACIMAVEGKLNRRFDWRVLKKCTAELGLNTGKAFNPGLQKEVNTYPAAAWKAVYGVDLADLFGGAAE